MALQLRGSRVKISKLTGALVAVFALFIQPLVALNVPSAFAAPVINEVMPKPVGISEADGEWVEIHNKGTESTDVSGWTLSDASSVRYTFAPTTTLAAGQYFVVCSDKTVNTEVACDDQWSGGNILNNTGDTLTLSDATTTVDSFTYATSDVAEGESVEVVREDNTTTPVKNSTTSYGTNGNSGTPKADNATQANSPVTNVNTGEGFSTIKKAIDDADTLNGHTIFIQNGTYDEDVVLTKSLTLEGESEAGVIIIADDGSYGLEDRGTGLTITLKNFTLQDAVTYGIKLDGNDATLQNVTVENSGSSEFDFNGMNSIVLRNVTANGNGTAGNGISFTNSNNIDLDGATTTGNNWGGVALYPYGTAYPPGINSAKIYNLNASEANELYQQVGSGGTPVGTLDAPQYTFGVTNDEFRPGAEQFTFYQRTLANASNFGRSLQVGNTDSAIFRLDTGVRIVPTNGFTIKAALEDAPANGTVRLQPGTHANDTEQIVAADNVTLVGSGVDTTTIAAQFSTGTGSDSRGWFLAENGVEFNVRNVTFDATGQNVWQAIRHKGSGSINNVAFRNIGYNPSSSYQGTAVAAFGTGATNVTNSTFENIGRIGVLYFGAGVSDSRFVGNTYTGKGDGNWLDYAADISAGADVRVVNNTITDNRGVALSDGSGSAGLLVTTFFASGTSARINTNTLQGNSTGVAVGFNDSDTSSVTARNNIIDGNDVGAYSTSTLADFRQNYWGSNSGPTDTVSGDGSIPDTNPGGSGDVAGSNIWYQNWITYDEEKPSLQVTSPSDDETIGGTATVSGQASDNVGVTELELRIFAGETCSGQAVVTENILSSYNQASGTFSYDFDTTQLNDGTYCFKVTARDDAGNKRFKTASGVIINNATGSGGSTGGGTPLDGDNDDRDPSNTGGSGSGSNTPPTQSSNSTPGTISPLSQLAFNQGIAGASNTGAASVFGSTPSTTGSSEPDDDTSGDVLGTESPSTDSSVKSAAVTQSPEGWKLFGIAWYWILLLLGALAALWWFLVARRRNAEENANL